MNGGVDKLVKHFLRGGRTFGVDTGAEVGGLVVAEKGKKGDDTILLVVRPRDSLEESDAGADEIVEEKLEGDGKEIKGVGDGEQGGGEIEGVEEVEGGEMRIEGASGWDLQGEPRRGGGFREPAIGEKGREVAAATEGGGMEVEIHGGGGGGGVFDLET